MMTNWIWTKNQKAEDREQVILLLFRKEIEIAAEIQKAQIYISADSRYKLYVNGFMVEMGPSRGDREVWYYDEIDIGTYLKKGKNVLGVQVLHYPMIDHLGNHGIFRTEYPGLFIKGNVTDINGNKIGLDADQSWKLKRDDGFKIVSEDEDFAPLQIFEERTGKCWQKSWLLPGYDDNFWENAWVYSDIKAAVSPGNLLPRTIPYLYRRERYFDKILKIEECSECDAEKVSRRASWNQWLYGNEKIIIPPSSCVNVEISAGEEMTGYINLQMQQGTDAEITIIQAESYVQEDMETGRIIKGNRTDSANGYLKGFKDTYYCAGYGDQNVKEIYEPFWFRTFRYIRLEIKTKGAPLILDRIHYVETGYPLETKTIVKTSDLSFEKIWEISERTLRRCMHETYEDCPYYEQLQYSMDSRTEILYTYAISADDRLARKCMDDFKRSQRYDGLLNCSYPCYGSNVIPGFSIYYIMMLHDHMMYFGDKDLLEEHMPVVESILLYFHKNCNENGYVDKIGGLNGRDRFWSFIDWTEEWKETTGVPCATLTGPITMESLLYCIGLQKAAEIAEYLEMNDIARKYKKRCERVVHAVQNHCIGKNGMIQDGPGAELYSQHAQVFGILSGVLNEDQGRKNLKETLENREQYAQCSVAMAFYLFRALQKTKLYEETNQCWDLWREMLDMNLTTCVEDPVSQRSDCHAWGALILYELPAIVLGIRPSKPGYEEIELKPETGMLTFAEGTVITPKGTVQIKWEKKEDEICIDYTVPKGIKVVGGAKNEHEIYNECF